MKKINLVSVVLILLLCTLFNYNAKASGDLEVLHIDEAIIVESGENITIQNKDIYRDVITGPLFNIMPGGTLTLENIKVDGDNGRYNKDELQDISNSPLINNLNGTIIINNSHFTNIANNYYEGNGGVIFSNDGNVNINNATFENNQTPEMGAFMYQTGASKISETNINNTIIKKNY